MRVMLFLWDAIRVTRSLDAPTASALLAAFYQHAEYLAEPANFLAESNHGMEMAGSLLAASYVLEPFEDSERWRLRATEMLDEYLAGAFSPEGFNREQSPSYQVFIMRRLAQIDGFLVRNDLPPIGELRPILDQALAAFRYIQRHNRSIPAIGDSARNLGKAWDQRIEAELGRPYPEPTPEPVDNPREDPSILVASPGAGYAIFASNRPGEQQPSDLHLTFKYNYFKYPHFHEDGLSFVLYWRGKEWLIDPGRFGYDWDRPERQYVRSSRAHNVVQVDGMEFESWPVITYEPVRTMEGDAIAARHSMPAADHTRAVGVRGPEVLIWDHLVARDDATHRASLFFHFGRGLDVEQTSVGVAARADQKRLEVDVNSSRRGDWRVISGQTEPELQGWWSPRSNVLEPAPVAALEFDFEGMATVVTSMKIRKRNDG